MRIFIEKPRNKSIYNLFTLLLFIRIFCFTIILFWCHCSYAQLPLGENPGYYGSQYTDQQIYDLMYAAGARSTRSTVPLQFDLQYGVPAFGPSLQYPYATKGMRNNTFFLFASPGPTYSTESTTKTAGGHQSWLPAGIYNAPFNADGSINTANAWAKYVYDCIQTAGPYYNYYEVWNEPDLTNSSDSYNDSTVSKTSWQISEPTPDELINMYDSLESYVQLCKIANQVVKKYYPNSKMCTGGIGYPWFYQWFLRKGGGQWVDELSFHEYPYFDWCYCAWTGSTCGPAGFHRNSDYAVSQVLAKLQNLRQIETNEKSVHLPAMMTEINIPRWNYVPSGDMEVFPQNRTWGTDHTQRNFTIKVFTKLMLAGLTNFYFYQTGETGDSGLNNGASGSEIDAMGMYKNLTKSTPGNEVITSQGLATRTMQTLIGNYKLDATQPTLPSGVDGVRFDSAGNKIYVIWAITALDTLETASGSFTLPAGATFKEYLYNGSSPGTATGTITLTGDPYIFIQNASVVTSVNCNAGNNQTITLPNTATLDASGSTATNSTISSYNWTQLSGPNTSTITNGKTVTAIASNFTTGSYIYQVLIKDANNDSCKSTVQITVDPAPTPPTVSAGNDQAITLPATLSLAGSASDQSGTITSYAWTEVSGPDYNVTFANANSISTTVNNLVAGTYVFKLTVADNNNLSAFAIITVTVNPQVQPIVVSAGNDQTIYLPSAVTLTGTVTDTTGTITNYTWSEVSGPDYNGTFTNANSISTSVNNLSEGSYVFQLTVTDNNNLSSSATITVTVDEPLSGSAGSNQAIILPASSATLTGTATDVTGTITNYTWSEVSGPDYNAIFINPNSISTTVNNLSAGTYIFQLTITDNNNVSVSSTVSISVDALPTVSAGSDQIITLPAALSLIGSANDVTGNITAYNWSEISGPDMNAAFTNPNSISTNVNNLTGGMYVFQLTVTDNNNLSASATVTIRVNELPVVSAGSNQTITLPTSTATLSGTATDATGSITGYVWSELSGPDGNATFTNVNAISTTVNNLSAGTYVFELTVTDNNNLSASATLSITINAALQLPVVSAGSNQTIIMPTSTATLTGTATDATGTITTYAWTEVSGPNTATITNATKATGTAGNLIAGSYVFQLKVTDNNNLSASSTVTIKVNAPPVVSAGSNQSITLPTSTTTLSGTATDATGTITAYVWTEVSGPNSATLSNPTKISSAASNLVAGTYVFQLKVTDNNNLSATAMVTIKVNALPVVSAGSNQTIKLPTSTATLAGTATDATGTITTYAWTEVSGPNSATLTNATKSSATASNLVAGSYVFQLKVTDNNNLFATAVVTIAVVYPPPVVSAGSNQTITLPTNTAILKGTATDATGTIITYAWTEVSGPNNATITNATSATATVSKLVAGTYVFQLKVTDSHNLSTSATVTIILNQPPVANAGTNQTITLPTNKATLSGSKSSDPDGSIASYNWARVSGPSTPNITGNKTVTATISGLVKGTYVYQLTVTDNRGATASATTQVNVNAAKTASVIDTQIIDANVEVAEQQSDTIATAVSETDKVILFPNPTKGIVNLQLISHSIGTLYINIFDILGRLALAEQTEKPFGSFNQSIDVSKLNEGFYIMQIQIGANRRMIIKFIKR
jgi:hypothetical protein